MTSSNRRLLGVAAAVAFVTTTGLRAQTPKIAPNQNYLFITADQASRLQAALDQAAGSGLEVVFGSNQGVFLKRTPDGAAPRAYWPIITGRVAAFEKELNAGGEQGFMVLPQTLTSFGRDVVVIMGRASGDSSKRSYRVLEWDGAFDKNLSQLTAKEFRPIGVFAQQSGMAAQLGRPGRLHVVLQTKAEGTMSKATAPASGWLRQVSATRTSNLEKEINEAAGGGYRVIGGSLMSVALERVDDPSTTYTYRVVGAVRGPTLATEIQQAGRDGYRLLPTAIMSNPGSRLETVVVMERASTPSRSYEYDFVNPTENVAHLALSRLEEAGFTPVGLLLHAGYSVVFEKAL